MSESKNFLLAIILSLIVLGLWQYFIIGPQTKQIIQQQHTTAVKRADEITGHEKIIPREKAIATTQRITINTPSLHGSINLKGARLDDLTLTGYQETGDKHSKDVALLSPSQTDSAYFAQFGWLQEQGHSSSVTLPDNNTIWQSDKKTLTPSQPVTLTWNNPESIRFQIIISLDKNYMFTIKQRVENASSKPISLMPYGLVNRSFADKEKHYAILHIGFLGVFDGTLKEILYETLLDDGDQHIDAKTGWAGFSDKYWLTALAPANEAHFKASITSQDLSALSKPSRYQTNLLFDTQVIQPHQAHVQDYYFFAGAKRISLLDEYKETHNLAEFDYAVDFGRLYFITKPFFLTLKYFHQLLGNFGLAILLLTVCIKIIMFPLANKSYISMTKMKHLQPQVLALKDRLKGNPQEMSREMMGLYRKNNVNPLSGCLPVLIQIPVFFALYKVLFITIEMRHAPFYGWITDLSAKDPTNIFTLFGLIHWNPPSILHFGILPIIMGITMILQGHLNPAPADPVQAKVMKMLPYIFMVLFASFPAGLLIYWAWNNTLSILQQAYIMKRTEKRFPQTTA